MPSIDDDRQLIDSILVGDQHTWEKIIRRFSDMVWRILLGRFRLSKDDAPDAFQEIFLALQKVTFVESGSGEARFRWMPTWLWFCPG